MEYPYHSLQLQSLSVGEQLIAQDAYTHKPGPQNSSEFQKQTWSFGNLESPRQTLSGSKSTDPSKMHKSIKSQDAIVSLNESKKSSDSEDESTNAKSSALMKRKTGALSILSAPPNQVQLMKFLAMT